MSQRKTTADDKKEVQATNVAPSIYFFPGRGKISTTRYGHIAIELKMHSIHYYFSYGESAKSVKDDEKKYGEPIKITLPAQTENIILDAISEMPKQFPPLGYNKFSNNCADAVLGFMQLAKYQVLAPVKASDLKITEFQPVVHITDPELIAKLACDIRSHAILEEKVKILNTDNLPIARVILFFENEIEKLENDKILEKIKNRNPHDTDSIKQINQDIAQLSHLIIQLNEMKKTSAPYAAVLSKLLDYGSQLSKEQFETCHTIIDLCGAGIETTRHRSTEGITFFESTRTRSTATHTNTADVSIENKEKKANKKI